MPATAPEKAGCLQCAATAGTNARKGLPLGSHLSNILLSRQFHVGQVEINHIKVNLNKGSTCMWCPITCAAHISSLEMYDFILLYFNAGMCTGALSPLWRRPDSLLSVYSLSHSTPHQSKFPN